jgi:hypothetical protein
MTLLRIKEDWRWRQRNEGFVASTAEISVSVQLVESADELNNACDLREGYCVFGYDFWRRFNGRVRVGCGIVAGIRTETDCGRIAVGRRGTQRVGCNRTVDIKQRRRNYLVR